MTKRQQYLLKAVLMIFFFFCTLYIEEQIEVIVFGIEKIKHILMVKALQTKPDINFKLANF